MRTGPLLALPLALLAGLAGGMAGAFLCLALEDWAHQGARRLLWLLRWGDVALAVLIVMSVAALFFAGVMAALGQGRVAWPWLVVAVMIATAATVAGFHTLATAGTTPRAFPAAAFWIGAAIAMLLRNRVVAR